MGEWTGGHMSECPAIAELKEALLEAVPLLKADPTKVGTTRGDGSRHDAGLAMDIMLDSRDIAEKAVADQIIDAVIAMHGKMKWSDILYTDWNGPQPFFFHVPGAPPFGGPKGMLKKIRTPSGSSASITSTTSTSTGGSAIPPPGRLRPP